jgi:hypothetical protein
MGKCRAFNRADAKMSCPDPREGEEERRPLSLAAMDRSHGVDGPWTGYQQNQRLCNGGGFVGIIFPDIIVKHEYQGQDIYKLV